MTRPWTAKVNPPPKIPTERVPPTTSSQSRLRQGVIFSTSDLPQAIKDMKAAGPNPIPTAAPSSKRQAANRKGVVLDPNNLPQELKNLRDAIPPRNNIRPA
ncbi:hypothetical protein PCASD_13462 [Puccinia coronata f. sp. avenae]|uniref:Uncharacterized protein n=1 Tax=Puccinia coronata f. sp. avenae TaxID=200324 RepID=A0A2N5TAC8_9BASI|nr:hypothetical protein PCASD_13462 [Puccinia coronata f. sp. avenae]